MNLSTGYEAELHSLTRAERRASIPEPVKDFDTAAYEDLPVISLQFVLHPASPVNISPYLQSFVVSSHRYQFSSFSGFSQDVLVACQRLRPAHAK